MAAKARPIGAVGPLAGIHLTLAAWLPPPDASRGWPGWLRQGPREYLVHPAAQDELLRLLVEGLAAIGATAVVNQPERTEEMAVAAGIASRKSQQQGRFRRQPPRAAGGFPA